MSRRPRPFGPDRIAALQTLALGVPIALDSETLADATCYRVGDSRIGLPTMRILLAWNYARYSDPLRGTVAITPLGRAALRRFVQRTARAAQAPCKPIQDARRSPPMRLPAPAVGIVPEPGSDDASALQRLERIAAGELWNHYLATRGPVPPLYDIHRDPAWIEYQRHRDKLMDLIDDAAEREAPLQSVRKAVARMLSHIAGEGVATGGQDVPATT